MNKCIDFQCIFVAKDFKVYLCRLEGIMLEPFERLGAVDARINRHLRCD